MHDPTGIGARAVYQRLSPLRKLIKIAKSEASKISMRGKIAVMDLGQYNPSLDGQAVVVEEAGGEYSALGGVSKSKTNR